MPGRRPAHLRDRGVGAAGGQRRRGTTARRARSLHPRTRRSIRQAVGFRNVLVHEYTRVNDDIVTGRLKALGDLQDFVSQVAAFVTHA
jgi:uncharacterized protein YutE (UPF0331/DUF86 family)